MVRCERARAEARVSALRALHDDVTSRRGLFEAPGGSAGDKQAVKQIGVIDKAIVSWLITYFTNTKHKEFRTLTSSLSLSLRIN